MRAWARYHASKPTPPGCIVLTQTHGTRLSVMADAIHSLQEGKDGTFVTLTDGGKQTRFWARESEKEITEMKEHERRRI